MRGQGGHEADQAARMPRTESVNDVVTPAWRSVLTTTGSRDVHAPPQGQGTDRGFPIRNGSEAAHQALFRTLASQVSAPSIGIIRKPTCVPGRATPVGRANESLVERATFRRRL